MDFFSFPSIFLYQSLLCHCLFPAQFFTSHCIGVVGWCRDVAPRPKWDPAGGLNGTDGAAVHPIPLLNTPGPLGSSPACLLGASSSVAVLTHNSES